MQARQAALSAYRPSYRPIYRQLDRYEPAPEFRVHPVMWVILASGAFWAVLIGSLIALFG